MQQSEIIERFLAVSYLYVQLTDGDARESLSRDLIELIEALNDAYVPSPCPDQGLT